MSEETKFLLALESTRDRVTKCTYSVLEYAEDETLRAKYLSELEKVLTDCIRAESSVTLCNRAAEDAITKAVDEKTGIPDADKYDEAYQVSLGRFQRESDIEETIANAPTVKAFRELLAQNGEGLDDSDGEELITTKHSINIIDPISKKVMTDPVRNKYCGHVYDRSSVTDMIKVKKKKGFKCPCMGCDYRKPLKLSDLMDALDVKRNILLEQMKNNNK